MAKQDEIIKEIESIIDDSVSSFNGRLPKIQQDAYAIILDLTSELETSNGKIKPSIKNVKIIAKIKSELQKIIFDKEYAKELDKVIDTYSTITKLQNQYFSSLVDTYKVPKVLKEVENLSIESVVDSLGENGMDVNIISPVRDILVKNVTNGGTRAEFTEEVRKFLVDTEESEGALSKYAKTIVTDSLNSFNANYNQIVSDSLGYEWYQYRGSIKDTTRDWCRKLIDARVNKCLEYIHVSQFNDLIEGKICDDEVPIYEKTGLPYGMKEGTNVANLRVNRGGWNCNHQFSGVPSYLVPKELRDKFKSS
jgi:hypothetical protein